MPKHLKLTSLGLTLLFSSIGLAEGIVESHIKTVGGKEAIAKIKTVHRAGTFSGTSSFGPLSGSAEEIFDLSKNQGFTSMSMSISGYAFSRNTGWTGESAWVSDTQSGVADLPADEASFAKYQGFPSPLAAIYADLGASSLKQGGDKKFNGKKCTVVTAGESPGEFYVNQKTNLLEGMSILGNVEVTFEDYRAVEGVQFAGKRTMKVVAQGMTLVYEYKTTKVNVQVDGAKFRKPTAHSEPTLAKSEPTSAKPALKRITAKEILSSMDKSGDGKISKDEASEDLKLFFGDIDANGDGAIDVKEAEVMAKYANEQAGVAEPTAAPGRVTAKQLISQMDKNGDGKISKYEAPDELKTNFQYVDTNGDGSIDEKEAQVMADYVNKSQDK